ncbi:MAG: helix-turn-helix domain-containing protein [Dehalococcoidia bacterium]
MAERDWRKTLRKAREQLGLSRAEVARRASLSEETVRGYESGRRAPTASSLNALLEALRLPQHERRHILAATGFAAPDTLFPGERFPNYFYTVEELQHIVEQVPWPEFVLNDNTEVIATNTIIERLWGVDFAQERAQRTSAQMNLLSVANDHLFTDHILNWDECVGTLIGVLKGRPRDPDSIDEPVPYLNAVLAEIVGGDPAFLRRLGGLWESVLPTPAKCRWTYRVVWRDDDLGELRFVALVNTASEPDGLGFNDWIPLDGATWDALEILRRRPQ